MLNLRKIISEKDQLLAWGIIILSFCIKAFYIFNLTHYSESIYVDMASYWNGAFERLNGNTHSISQYAIFPTCYIFVVTEFLRLAQAFHLIAQALPLSIYFSLFLYALSAYAFYKIALKLINRKWLALLALIFYAFSYTALYLNALVLPENLAIPLLVIITAEILLNPLSIKRLILVGLCLGLIIATKPVFLFMSVAFFYFIFRKTVSQSQQLKFLIFALAFLVIPVLVVCENYKISNGKLFGLGAYGGANFYAGWTKAGKIVSSSPVAGGWWVCGTPFIDGTNPKTVTFNEPFFNQGFWYNQGLLAIKDNPWVLIEKISWFKNLFFGLFTPTHNIQPYGYNEFAGTAQMILVIASLFAFIFFFYFKEHPRKYILSFFYLLILFFLIGLYLMGYPEKRYFFSIEFIVLLLFFTSIDWLISTKNFFVNIKTSIIYKKIHRTIQFFPVIFLILIVFYIYQPAYLDYARRDEILFLQESNNYKNNTEFFINSINYNRTRHASPGDYYLFRPGLHTTLGFYDSVLRTNLLFKGLTSIFLHLIVVLLIYFSIKKYFNQSLALPLAAIFASQYPGIEMVIWRHVSFYMLSCLFTLMSFLVLFSAHKFKHYLFGLFLFLAMIYHEAVPVSFVMMIFIILISLKLTKTTIQDNLSRKLILISILSILIFLTLDAVSWFITKPPSLLGSADSLTINFDFLKRSVLNFFHYLGVCAKTFLYPFYINFNWTNSMYDWAYYSLNISSANLIEYLLWSVVACILILTVGIISLRKIVTSHFSFRDLISFWSCCALISLTLMYSFMRLSLRDTSYSDYSTYYYWFSAFFYTFICAYLFTFLIKKIQSEHHQKILILFIFIFAMVFVTNQSLKARNALKNNYDLPWAKQIIQASNTADLYFKMNPDQCLDTDEKNLAVPPRHRQYFTLPYYLNKYNCGRFAGTSVAHLSRSDQGITYVRPGPYPDKDHYKPE